MRWESAAKPQSPLVKQREKPRLFAAPRLNVTSFSRLCFSPRGRAPKMTPRNMYRMCAHLSVAQKSRRRIKNSS